MKFSLVIATIGRQQELKDLLSSLLTQRYDLKKIEIIIVDQNEVGYLDDFITDFSNLNIVSISSDKRGLSYNRNIGIQKVTGDVICFPDDDCKFYMDTFVEVVRRLEDDKTDFCIGRIYDRNTNTDILKKWPTKQFYVTRLNAYFITSSITMFIKKKSIENFDVKLGSGSVYGSCEDADLIYRIIKKGCLGVYSPNIQLWHPEPNYNVISLQKVRNYSSGFGYFVRKETDVVKIVLLLLLIIKKATQMLSNLFNNRFKRKYFYNFSVGLLSGLRNKND